MSKSKRKTISPFRKEYNFARIPWVSPPIGVSWVTCSLLNQSLARRIKPMWGGGLFPMRHLATEEEWIPEESWDSVTKEGERMEDKPPITASFSASLSRLYLLFITIMQ